MNRKWGMALVVTGALMLSACGGSTQATHKPSARPTVSPRAKFLAVVHAETDDVWPADSGNPPPTDAQIAVFPPRWCAAAKAGHSLDYMINTDPDDDLYPVGENWGTVQQDAGKLVVQGVQAYCPAYSGRIEAEARALGWY